MRCTDINVFIIVYRMGRLCGGAHEISGIKAQFFSVGGWGVVGWGWVVVGWGWWVGGGVLGGAGVGVVVGAMRFFQSNSNSQKLSLWCKKKHYPPRWICMIHIWFPTEFPRGIIIFQGVLTKFNFLTKFPHLEKICRFNERPKT